MRAAAWHDFQQYLFRAALALNVRSSPVLTINVPTSNMMAGKNTCVHVILPLLSIFVSQQVSEELIAQTRFG